MYLKAWWRSQDYVSKCCDVVYNSNSFELFRGASLWLTGSYIYNSPTLNAISNSIALGSYYFSSSSSNLHLAFKISKVDSGKEVHFSLRISTHNLFRFSWNILLVKEGECSNGGYWNDLLLKADCTESRFYIKFDLEFSEKSMMELSRFSTSLIPLRSPSVKSH